MRLGSCNRGSESTSGFQGVPQRRVAPWLETRCQPPTGHARWFPAGVRMKASASAVARVPTLQARSCQPSCRRPDQRSGTGTSSGTWRCVWWLGTVLQTRVLPTVREPRIRIAQCVVGLLPCQAATTESGGCLPTVAFLAASSLVRTTVYGHRNWIGLRRLPATMYMPFWSF